MLPFFNITLLVPSNDAFNAISGPDLAVINSKGSAGWLQVVAFHAIFPAFTSTDFNALPQGAEVGLKPPHPWP